MRVAFRFIYNNSVAPSCHIIDMTDDVWLQFLEGDQKLLACQLLNMESEADKVQMVSWMPIDGLEEILQPASEKKIRPIFDKSTLRMYLQPFLEMNTSLTCNQVSRIINIVKEHHNFAKKKQPTVNDLTAMSVNEVMASKRMGKRTLQIVQETLTSYGLDFCNK